MSFKLTILGSGSAIPTVDRNPTAQLLNVNERFFLIDCGEVVINIMKNEIREFYDLEGLWGETTLTQTPE